MTQTTPPVDAGERLGGDRLPVEEPPDRRSKPLAYSYWLGTFVIRGSVLPRISLDVLGFGVLATATVLLSQYVAKNYSTSLSMPSGPFEAAGAVLGLLLVLRLNAGYDRWWEARKLWGGIVNESRNLAIAGLAYGPKDAAWQTEFIKWVAAWPHVTRRSLRSQRNVPELQRLLTAKQIEWLLTNEHLPDAVSRRIAGLLATARARRSNGMDGFGFYQAERQRGLLIDYLGGCERILKTPLARSGAIQVRQFIFVFLAALPLSLLKDFEGTMLGAVFGDDSNWRIWFVPVFIMLLAFMLLALDRIGMELQNPFDQRRVDFLPLDNICTTIERNVLELLHQEDYDSAAAPRPGDVEMPPDAETHISEEPLTADIS